MTNRGYLILSCGEGASGRLGAFPLSDAGQLLSSGDLPLRSIPPTALRLWAPPSNVPEVGHGSRRRQPPRFCGKIKHNSVQNGLRTQRPCKHGPRKHNHPGNTYSLPLPLSLMSKVSTSGLVKFTFASHPRQKALRGTLGFEVNFTGWGAPSQKYLRGRFGNLVKFTFRGDPLQKAFWGRLAFEVERLCVHLRAIPPLQCPQRHIGFRGEFHGLRLPLAEVLQRPIGESREIDLARDCHKEF